jgi:hypothetical protein
MNAPLRRLFGGKSTQEVTACIGMVLRDFPDYADAEDALRAQRAKRDALAAELRDIDAKLDAGEDPDLDELALRELRGEELDLPDLRQRRGDVARREQVAVRAEAAARESLRSIKAQRAAALASLHLPLIRAAVREVAKAMQTVHLANRALEAAVRQLEAAGVTQLDGGVAPLTFTAGDLYRPTPFGGTPAEIWFAAARREGYIGEGESPSDLEAGR